MPSRSVNKVILLGTIGRDADLGYTPSGVSVTRFSLATNRRWKDQQTDEWRDEVNWTNVVLWRQENLVAYITKGKQVYVEGRLQTRSYEDRDGKKLYATEVIAEEVILLGGKSEKSDGAVASDSTYERNKREFAKSTQRGDAYEGMEITDDDVPF